MYVRSFLAGLAWPNMVVPGGYPCAAKFEKFAGCIIFERSGVSSSSNAIPPLKDDYMLATLTKPGRSGGTCQAGADHNHITIQLLH